MKQRPNVEYIFKKLIVFLTAFICFHTAHVEPFSVTINDT